MQTFTNNAYGFLASGVSAAATTLVLGTGEGARFPTTSGDNFKITLIALTNGQETAWEIVNVTGRSSDTLTVQRAQEGTTALVWPSLTRVELRLTAGATESKANLGTAAYTASTAYATAAQGVTDGDSHDHSGGAGGQIAYSSLSSLPTLGTAAAKNIPASGNASATEVVYGSDTRLHVAATVADTNSINLTLTGQQISADAVFGTTATTIAVGDHTHDTLYPPLGADLADFTSGAAASGQVPTADGAGGVAWAAIPVTEPINYQAATANVTVDWSTGPVQYLYVNPAGASIQITLPADPGALSQAGILFVKNNTGKAHTWNTSPAIRFVGETDADIVPTPAAVTYWTRYTVQWNDYAAAWYVTLAGKDTA